MRIILLEKKLFSPSTTIIAKTIKVTIFFCHWQCHYYEDLYIIRKNNSDLLSALDNGFQPTKPEHMSQPFYDVILSGVQNFISKV